MTTSFIIIIITTTNSIITNFKKIEERLIFHKNSTVNNLLAVKYTVCDY